MHIFEIKLFSFTLYISEEACYVYIIISTKDTCLHIVNRNPFSQVTIGADHIQQQQIRESNFVRSRHSVTG